MKTFNSILSILKQMENNEERTDFLNLIVNDKNIPRDDLRKITCKTFIENNFVENYFKLSFVEIVKLRVKKLYQFFSKKLKKK